MRKDYIKDIKKQASPKINDNATTLAARYRAKSPKSPDIHSSHNRSQGAISPKQKPLISVDNVDIISIDNLQSYQCSSTKNHMTSFQPISYDIKPPKQKKQKPMFKNETKISKEIIKQIPSYCSLYEKVT